MTKAPRPALPSCCALTFLVDATTGYCQLAKTRRSMVEVLYPLHLPTGVPAQQPGLGGKGHVLSMVALLCPASVLVITA